MKHALISPDEKIYDVDGSVIGERIAEVCAEPFEVATPLYWVDCDDNVVADQWYWDGTICIMIAVEPVFDAISSEPVPQVGPNVVA